jgi:hypothetical protein
MAVSHYDRLGIAAIATEEEIESALDAAMGEIQS